MLSSFYIHRWVVVNAWGRFGAYKESIFEHLLSTEAQGVGGGLCNPPINDIICHIVPWCFYALVVGSGYRRDELIELDLCVPFVVFIAFVPIVEKLGETGSLGGWENFSRLNLK